MATENKALRLEKKITSVALELNELKTRKKKFIVTLQNLNKTYQQNKISYEQYSLLWTKEVSHQTAEYWVEQYEAKEQEFIDEINVLKARKKEEADKKTEVSVTLSYTAVLVIMLASIAALTITPGGIAAITGFAGVNDSVTFESEVNITAWLSVALSDELADCILFPLSAPPATDVNATDNINETTNGTMLFIAVSEDSNINVDTCINASHFINEYSDVLAIGNMTYAYYYNVTNSSVPEGPAASDEMTQVPVKTQTNMEPGTSIYYRFWMDAPERQLPGTYNNTVEFRSMQTGKSCT